MTTTKENSLIPWNKLLIIFWLGPFVLDAQAQNIYSYENSLRFAWHLEKNSEFKLAAQEYKRLLDQDPLNDSIRLAAVVCFRKAVLYDSGLVLVKDVFTKKPEFYKEYINILLLKNEYNTLLTLMKNDTLLSQESKELIVLDVLLLKGEWKRAAMQLEKVSITPMERVFAYNALVDKGLSQKRKKPAVAFMLSLLVPGLGKVYAGESWDGIASLTTFGLLAFSSFRGFYGGGEKSIPGWLFGAAASGFYAGNLYGTIKTVKKYNNKIQQKLHEDAESLIFSHF